MTWREGRGWRFKGISAMVCGIPFERKTRYFFHNESFIPVTNLQQDSVTKFITLERFCEWLCNFDFFI
jgi:hypothetical protein